MFPQKKKTVKNMCSNILFSYLIQVHSFLLKRTKNNSILRGQTEKRQLSVRAFKSFGL